MFRPTDGAARIFPSTFMPWPGFEPRSEELHQQQGTFIQDTLATELQRLWPMNLVSTIIHSPHVMRVQSN